MTLAFGETCVAVQKTPPPDVREYASRPSQAYQAVDRTLFCMVDGGSAPCCKVDTQDVEGKNGEAGTRQIRVGLFGEYGWLDRKGHPTPWEDSLSYFVSGENIAIFTPILKFHGVSRGYWRSRCAMPSPMPCSPMISTTPPSICMTAASR